MNSMGARMPMSFTPMQVDATDMARLGPLCLAEVQNMGTSADEPGQYPGVMVAALRT